MCKSMSYSDQLSIEQRMNEAKTLIQRLAKYSEANIEGSRKLLNKVKAEVRFLEKVLDGSIVFKESHVSSTNLKSLQAIVNVADRVGLDCISCLLHPFTYNTVNDEFSVRVDVVGSNGRLWVKAVARKAAAQYAVWKGDGQYGEKNLAEIGEQYVLAAKQHPVDFRAPTVVFSFSDGVPSCIARKLHEMNIYVEGEIVEIDDDDDDDDADDRESSQRCVRSVSLSEIVQKLKHSDKSSDDLCLLKDTQNKLDGLSLDSRGDVRRKANLDVTALLCLVSNLTNGSDNFNYGVPVLNKQADQERLAPALPGLTRFLSDRDLVACETAVTNFKKIIATIGGPSESHRSEELLKRIEIVKDRPSTRTLNLESSSKINQRAKVIFGTGDSERAVTVTANVGFVRAAAQAGVQYSVFLHEARALTEIKETRRRPDRLSENAEAL